VGVAGRGEDAGHAAPAGPDSAGSWPGAGDFDDLVRRYRRELHVYCYRMLGSFDEAEDHVQEVFLRAWRSRERFQGRSSPRTWLYRVAANACLDTLRRDARRAVPAPSSAPAGPGPSIAAMPWVQPYPDSLLDEMAAGQPGPEAVAVSRETISLAFLAAIQLLPPRQRAVLILRDVAGWPAAEVAGLLDMSVPAVNSALRRARATLRDRWPVGGWTGRRPPNPIPGSAACSSASSPRMNKPTRRR
jgi:RNA polymerase sigma-70 factor (ECF subfamily)